jgi:hypothetical protein
MMITKTTQVAREIISKGNQRFTMIFNDKLTDGTRSLKVVGWSAKEYGQATRKLRAMGCKVKVLKTRSTSERYASSQRLHVTE